MQGLVSEKFEIADVVGAYMAASRLPLSGSSLDQALNKATGMVEILAIGAVDTPSPDARHLFDSTAPEQRKILFLSVVSLCYFSTRARARLQALALSFDHELAKGIVA